MTKALRVICLVLLVILLAVGGLTLYKINKPQGGEGTPNRLRNPHRHPKRHRKQHQSQHRNPHRHRNRSRMGKVTRCSMIQTAI